MGKRHPHLPAWQWRICPTADQDANQWAQHLIAVALFVVAFLLIVSGVFSPSIVNVAMGVIGVVAALGLERRRR